jgi:signal transduction histidine kinase/AraC-like DNA-binding protein
MPKHHFIYISFLLFVGLSCSSEKRTKKYQVGFSQCCDDPWRDIMNQEMQRELAFYPEIDLKLRVASNNSETQTAQIKELLHAGIDLLIVSPNEEEPLTEVINEVFNAGIPVILIDRKTNSEKYSAYIGADNNQIGETAATYIANEFKEKGHIIELQLGMTMTPAKERSRGFQNVISHYPDMKIMEKVEMKAGIDSLKVDFLGALKAHPSTNIIFAHNDFLAENAYKWAEEIGLSEKLYFVGVDGIPGIGKGIQAIEDGTLNASLLYPTGGAEAIRLSVSILNNLPFERKNLLQTIVINQGNARILHLQMKKVESLQKNIEAQLKIVNDLNHIYRNQQVYIIVLISILLLAIVLGLFLYKSLKSKELINENLEIKNKEAYEQQQQILQISHELEQATQAKVDFFTNISHEFRTPLTLILGYLEGLISVSNVSTKDARQDLSMVRKNALRLLRLVNQLMDFRKIESGKMSVRASENDLIAFSENIVKAYQKMANKRNIDLQFFATEKELITWFDVNMIDKVLFNLLSNAFKFTNDGGKIKVNILKDTITERAILIVEDNGKGMTKESVEHAFEQFYQDPNNNKARGSGLGLSLSKELVHLHKGEIELWSELNKGTRFEIRLPLGKAHLKPEQCLEDRPDYFSYEEFLFFEEDKKVPSKNVDAPSSIEQNLLIIEDNHEVRAFLKKHFEKTYNIFEAENGNKGLDMAFELIPDLIISDILMPGKDGLALTRIFKSDLRTSHIPIILLTAQNTMEQKIVGVQTGADAYLSKPFNLVFLEEIIKNLIEGRENLRKQYSGVLKLGKLPNSLNNLDQQFLRNFTSYIENNYADANLNVERMSEEFGLSRVHLYRKVKALLGESVNDYIQHIRLKKACQLLLEQQWTVAEIAYKVGYSSPSYFATAFKNRYACSPTEYKDKNLK